MGMLRINILITNCIKIGCHELLTFSRRITEADYLNLPVKKNLHKILFYLQKN